MIGTALPESSGWRLFVSPWLNWAWNVGLMRPGLAARLLVSGHLPFSLVERVQLHVPGESKRTEKLLAAVPLAVSRFPLPARDAMGLAFLLGNLPARLFAVRHSCLSQLVGFSPEMPQYMMSSLVPRAGLSLAGPILDASLDVNAQAPLDLSCVQAELFRQLRAHLRLDGHWDPNTRDHLFLQCAMIFASSIAPTLCQLLVRRGHPHDMATLRLLVFCRRRLLQAKHVAATKKVSGVEWISSCSEFMDWSRAYLDRVRLDVPVARPGVVESRRL